MRVTLTIEMDVDDESVRTTHVELMGLLTAAVGAVEDKGRIESCSYDTRGDD